MNPKPLVEVLKDLSCEYTVRDFMEPQEDLLEKFDRGEIDE